MTPAPAPKAAPTFPWWLVLGLIGLDYFSTLAYLPSIAVDAVRNAGWPVAFAPLAVLGIVLVTLLGALPLYWYIAGRSHEGEGATALLGQNLHGWSAKAAVLVLLGFVATDLVVTRSLSTSDAAAHIRKNPYWVERVEWSKHHADEVRAVLPGFLRGWVADFVTEQLVITVLLSVLGFGFWALIWGGFTRWFMRLAALVVVVYLGLTALVVVGCLGQVAATPDLWQRWLDSIQPAERSRWGLVGQVTAVCLMTFPQLALGLSGFELILASAPRVAVKPGGETAAVRSRVWGMRWLMLAAALIMSLFLVPAVLVVGLLVPPGDLDGGPATHRALSYLAHGGGPGGGPCAGLFGPGFGTLYDLSSVLILCLAGASVTLGLAEMVPRYLTRFGMQLRWAARVGATMHLFNVIILVVTVVFRADVADLQWAYAASVLALLTGAALATLADVDARLKRSPWRRLLLAPISLLTAFLLAMVALTLWINASGLLIALTFIGAVFGIACLSRYLRSTELRFDGFAYPEDAGHSQRRWEEVRHLDFQILVPHRPGHETLAQKEKRIRDQHRLGGEVPIVFIEVVLGDTSDFSHRPLLQAVHEEDREVLRISRCASVAHVLAAVCLEFTNVGRPPEIYFDWSGESPVAANLNFLLFGYGNVPWLVHDLIVRNQPDAKLRPRVVVG